MWRAIGVAVALLLLDASPVRAEPPDPERAVETPRPNEIEEILREHDFEPRNPATPHVWTNVEGTKFLAFPEGEVKEGMVATAIYGDAERGESACPHPLDGAHGGQRRRPRHPPRRRGGQDADVARSQPPAAHDGGGEHRLPHLRFGPRLRTR